MKKIAVIYFLVLLTLSGQAQRSKDARLEDSIFSWKAIPKLKTVDYPRTFSPVQLKHHELFAQWLQKSYIPIGALDFSYAVAEPNKKDEVQPYGTGINAAMWRAAWDNSGIKVVRQPHSENPIYMLTNYIIDAEPITMLTIPGRAVFMRRSPEIEKAFMGSSEYRNKFVKQLKLGEHPQIGKYIVQYYGCDGDGCQPRVAVYLAPDNKLPIRQLTRGEVLDMCEQAIPAEAEKAREKISGENRTWGAEAQQKWVKHFDDETLPRWRSNIQKLRDRYRGSLNIPAELRNSNGIYMVHFYNGDDIFDTDDAKRSNNNTYGVYTYEKGVLEKSKQDQPLWICISWKPADIQYAPYEREIHRSITTHLDFDYVYDYFFRSEHIKNRPYTIRNAEAWKANKASFKKANTGNPVAARKIPANAYYFEGFSGNGLGEHPRGWYMQGVGIPSVIAVPAGQTGKWLKLGQQRVMPVNMDKQLPGNFRMEFDVATDVDFTENTGGAFLLRIHNKILTPNGDYKDAPNPVYIDFDAKAGNTKFTQNPTGYSRLKATYKGMNSNLRYGDVLQYSNDFSNRKSKVHFIITREANKVRAYIDGKEIMAVDKYGMPIPGFNELPGATGLTSFYFENITDHNSKHLGVYISNISITAL